MTVFVQYMIGVILPIQLRRFRSICFLWGIRTIWPEQCENESLGISGQRKPRSASASAQYDQGLRCPLTESFDIIECINGEQKPELDFAHARAES